jgi:hypothetical protein
MRDIAGYEGRYAVTSDGRIWSYPKPKAFASHKGRWLKPSMNSDGYPCVSMIDSEGRKVTRRVHRFVAAAFLENPSQLPQVNHKDGNKTNNHVENLEWCSNSENMAHAYRVGLMPPTTEKQMRARSKSVQKATAVAAARAAEIRMARQKEMEKC